MKNIYIKLAGIILLILSIFCCAGKEIHGSGFYNFEYNGEEYRIRSVLSENNGFAYNELIGKKFLAIDYDQDGEVDKISLGTIDISDAQGIYEYALDKLKTENKLQEVKPVFNFYNTSVDGYDCEVKSFQPSHEEPFNQFKILENDQNATTNFILGFDQQADGIIDTVALGEMSLEQMQTLYSELISRGLNEGVLIKVDNKIFVK